MKKPIEFGRLLGAKGGHHQRGSALLITLAFVILLTVLIVSFLSRALLEQHISSSSANQIKSELFSQGVEATLIGDLEQEIISGSTAQSVPTSTGSITLYVPNAPANMVPAYDYPGCPTSSTAPAATLANLLKVSNASPTGTIFPTATSALTTTPSFNGRSVSLARWTESCMTDPTGTLPTPQWVMVARDGTSPTGSFVNSGTNDMTLKLGSKANTKTVIGRYAYVIYDEGGLIDMNVAGQPTPIASGTAPAPYNTVAAYRNGETFADLTQIHMTQTQIDNLIGWRNTASAQISGNTSTGTFASAFSAVTAPTTSTPYTAFTWSAANATNYVSNVQNNSTGNLSVANPVVSNVGKTPNSTDQAFTSRYELIQFIQNLYNSSASTTNLNNANTALQYMTHFSRGLSQPSFIPNPNRPITPTSTSNDATWYGAKTNSAVGNDLSINPSFLAIRVSTAFTRNDGSAANIGEPLVKKRFNLNRLAWLTYEGPISDGSHYGTATSAMQVNASNADIRQLATYLNTYYGLSYAFLSQGTAGNIYNYFGLSWVKDDSTIRTRPLGDNQMKWYYNHTLANVAGTATASPYTTLPSSFSGSSPYAGCTSILKLSDVAALASAREADFVELLKAGITAGSKAKAATIPYTPSAYSPANQTPNPGGSTSSLTIVQAMPNNVANQVDTSLSFHLIQVFANIIDQFHLEGYPARIVYCDGVIVPKEFIGVENLPYSYRVRCCNLENLAPTGIIAQTGTTTITSSTTFINNPSVTQAGAYTTLLVPEIWNPHDQNSPRCGVYPSGASQGNYFVDSHGNPLYPTNFRIVADSVDPDDVVARPGVISTADLATIKNNYYDLGAPQVEQNDNPPSQYLDTAYTYKSQLPWPAGASGITLIQSVTTHPFPLFADSASLTFTIPSATSPSADTGKGFYREPTLLMTANMPANSSLAAAGNYNFLVQSNYANAVPGGQDPLYPSIDASTTGSFTSYVTANGLKGSDGNYYLGFYYGTAPGAWIGKNTTPDTVYVGGTMDSRNYNASYGKTSGQAGYNNIGGQSEGYITYRVQYKNTYDANSGWTTYDAKYGLSGSRNGADPVGPPGTTLMNANEYSVAYDPRTYRFSFPHCCSLFAPGYKAMSAATYYGWLDTVGGVLVSARPDYSNGYWTSAKEGPLNDPPNSEPDAYGWSTSGEGLTAWVSPLGLTAQNDPDFSPNGKVTITSSPAVKYNNTPSATPNGGTSPQYYADPDGVVRRGTAAFASSVITSSSVSTGLPTATANAAASGIETANSQVQSRPIILHRPFKTVAELGYVFSGTPWKNLDFNTPESGDAALLDLFTLNDTTDPNGLVAGKVNLNTQQVPVLQAILAGAYKDEEVSSFTAPTWATPALSTAEATAIAKKLVARTLSTNTAASQGPLQNVSELVGKYVTSSPLTIPNPNPNMSGNETLIDGSKSYAGFTSDQIASSNTNDLTSALGSSGANSGAITTAIQRMRESAVRALSSAGQTRVWNVMIDVVAQTGNYPPTATSFDQFSVQGEQRYWIHLAIDRLTGQIIDKQVEIVKE